MKTVDEAAEMVKQVEPIGTLEGAAKEAADRLLAKSFSATRDPGWVSRDEYLRAFQAAQERQLRDYLSIYRFAGFPLPPRSPRRLAALGSTAISLSLRRWLRPSCDCGVRWCGGHGEWNTKTPQFSSSTTYNACTSEEVVIGAGFRRWGWAI